jgi:hypothetical protein
MSYAATHEIIRNVNTLNCPQKMVLTVIASYASNHNLSCFPSVKTIAEKCRLSSRSVQRYIASLVNLGFLERVYRKGTSAITRITLPSTPTPTPTTSEGYDSAVIPGYDTGGTVICPFDLSQPITAAIATPLPKTVSPLLLFSEIPEQPEQPTPLALVDAPTAPVESVASVSAPAAPLAPVEPAVADPVEAAWAEVPAQVIADLQEIRKAKKKAPKPTKTEVQHWYSVAMAAGWSLQQIVYVMVLNNWSKLNDASWITGMIPPQTTAPGTPKLWQETPYTPASASTVARMKAEIAKMKARWNESSSSPPMRK